VSATPRESADPGRGELSLRADCSRCVGLCCVALTLTVSADFAIDKPAGKPCPNLQQPDHRCGIHTHLRESGFRGCAAYDCFGAGQHVTQGTFGGQTWREAPASATQMFAVFAVMRQLHELLWHLTEALRLVPPGVLNRELRNAYDETEQLASGSADATLAIHIATHRERIASLLVRTSKQVRAAAGRSKADREGAATKARPGADLIGADLHGADLLGVNLRGAYLIAADLRGADLRLADLSGADLRDADLTGADLSDSIFLTQSQLESARGDDTTALPPTLIRPTHWPHTVDPATESSPER
jgi:uncharacterized protein YjbI with pentapeptide repeats